MWKLLIGFAIFAGLAIFILTRSGGNVDLGGEKHEVAPAAAPAAASAPSAAPSAASAPASAASS